MTGAGTDTRQKAIAHSAPLELCIPADGFRNVGVSIRFLEEVGGSS
jgi:hypothetical protein